MVAGVAIGGVGLLVGVFQQTAAVPLIAALRLGWVSALLVLTLLGTAIGFTALALIDAKLIAFFVVPPLAAIPVLAVTLVLTRWMVPVVPSVDIRAGRAIMRDIAAYAVAVVFYVLYFRLAVLSVSLLSTQDETGYYAASFRILDVLAMIPPLLASSAFPLFARAARVDRERFHYAIGGLFHGMLILGAWIAVALVLGAQIAVDVVAGPEFEPAIEPLRIQALALLGTSVLAVWGYGLLSLGRHRAIMLGNLAAIASSGLLSLVLVPRYGAVGAAVALTTAELILAACYGLALLGSELALRSSLGVAPRILAAAGLALAVPLAAGLEDVVAVATATAVYAIALVALRAVPGELKQALLGRVTGPPAA
jgi:O-antigen/teichoic acid export membrane protein